MQVLIVYSSKTGNTKKLAEAIAGGAEEVPGVKSILKPVSQVTREDLLQSRGLIAGSPVYFGSMTAEMKEFFDKYVGLRKKMENKVGAAFATSADPSGGKETTMISILQAMLIYGMIVVGDPIEATGHYGVACVGSPDENARYNGAKLGKRVAALALKLSEG